MDAVVIARAEVDGGEVPAIEQVPMLLVLVTLLSIPLFLAMLRRSITLDRGTLTIRSSFYTRRLDVKDIESIEINGPDPELLHRMTTDQKSVV